MSGFQILSSNVLMPVAILLLCVALPGAAQTQIHLQTEGKVIDFTSANSSRTAMTGTTHQAVFATGEVFSKSNATTGNNPCGNE